MESVIREIKLLKEKNELAQAQYQNKLVFEKVMRDFEHNVERKRLMPSNIKNHQYYGSRLYNSVLYYLGY